MKTVVILLLIFSFQAFSEDLEKYNYFVRDLDNNIVSIKKIFTQKMDNKVKALVFFQTTCLPCIAEHKLLQEILTENEKKQIILMNLNETKRPIKKYLKKFGISFYTLIDMYGMSRKAFNIKTIPTILFLKKDFKVIEVWPKADLEKIKREFKKVLKK